MNKLPLILAILITMMVSCNEAKKPENTIAKETETIDYSADEEKIKELFSNWVNKVSGSENPQNYFEFVTDDFILSEPNGPAITDRNALTTNVKEFMSAFSQIQLKDWKSEEIIIRDDIAIHRHSGVLVLTPKGDTTKMEASLKYLDILKKNENGEWNVYIHSNMPDK